ncbi:unnamed protein product [Orchesella dallaii]|uniref:Transmembrane protein n=1 Tax=Orchesella dallaii TaxID=48710 RepID=A0ABP1RCU3_9HEXA
MHVDGGNECFEMRTSDVARILSVESLPQVVCQGVKSSGGSGNFMSKWIKFVAGVDLVLLVVSITLVFVSEAYICGYIPIVLDHSNSTNKYTLYDTVKHAVYDNYNESPVTHHVLVGLLLFVGTIYIVIEVWSICVLIKISTQENVMWVCLKWLGWRSLVVGISVAVLILDLEGTGKSDCGGLIVVPFQILRMVIGSIPVLMVFANQVGNES